MTLVLRKVSKDMEVICQVPQNLPDFRIISIVTFGRLIGMYVFGPVLT